MIIEQLDHLVMTVRDLARTRDFYVEVLGMQCITFGAGRLALQFGSQKINLHLVGHEFEPKAALPQPGSLDLCLLTNTPLDTVIDELQQHQVVIIEGPVARTGARGPILSVYIRDPDGNLIEIANRL